MTGRDSDAVTFVAEVSSNHDRQLSRCLAFVEASADAGCDAVKFQLFRMDELFAPDVLRGNPEISRRREWELPLSFLPEISGSCRSRKILFACSPFYLRAVEELYPYVDFYKIASYELLWKDLLHECARTGKPVALSTGMATLEEVELAVESLAAGGCRDLTLLHCVSSYPVPPEECNLGAIESLRRQFQGEGQGMRLSFGWSDHSTDPAVIYRAVHRWKAEMVEFHLDLDGEGAEFASGHCWLPRRIAPVIRTVRDGIRADGSGVKGPAAGELPERKWRADPEDGLRPLADERKAVDE
jgi:sialic acid synthase SpsE